MPWTVTDPMLERAKLVALHAEGLFSVTELAQRAGISRKTAYKWIGRYADGGADALADRSQARRAQAHRTPPHIEALLVACREAHPFWGPKKILLYLAKRHAALRLPARSTVGAILDRHGLVDRRPKRRKPTHPGTPPFVAEAPGDLWTVDFKGEFRTGDGIYCYPLTVCDACSRYILCCHGYPSVAHQGPVRQFMRLFHEHGLPTAIRSDNGGPFVYRAVDGLSHLNVLWTRLGIAHQRIHPGRPDQNGRHERMHRTLKAETARPPRATMAAQQVRFDDWTREFNEDRPHESLGGAEPSTLYHPSNRPMPTTLPRPEYAGYAEVRRVSSGGSIRFKGHEVFVSGVLARESVALTETDDGIWSMHFYERFLGRVDERTYKLSG